MCVGGEHIDVSGAMVGRGGGHDVNGAMVCVGEHAVNGAMVCVQTSLTLARGT